ncbi:MAG TPA: hypothetical protein VHO70_13970 [Chitinispirillaceae bacterium]|nr:hypothetical protein [Chitinispirillaceae bacterium]
MCRKNVIFLAVSFIFTTNIFADVIDITLNNNPPYMTQELSTYLPTVNASNEQNVGFDAVDIGRGTGDGKNEVVAFSFVFQKLTEVESAYLTIDMTAKGTYTDELLFADNSSVRGGIGAKFYGNSIFKTLNANDRTLVTCDLSHLSITDQDMNPVGFEDLTSLLFDGDLNVVYADDAIIHSARLQINGSNNPQNVDEPGTFVMLIAGMLLLTCIVLNRKEKMFLLK